MMYYHFPHSNAQHSKVVDHKLDLFFLNISKTDIVEVLQLLFRLFFCFTFFSFPLFRQNELPFMFRYFSFFFFFCCFFVTYEWTFFFSPKVQIIHKKENKIAGTFGVRSKEKIGFTAMLAKITVNFSRRFCESTRIRIFFSVHTIQIAKFNSRTLSNLVSFFSFIFFGLNQSNRVKYTHSCIRRASNVWCMVYGISV